MSNPITFKTASINLPDEFEFNAVREHPAHPPSSPPPPPLGPLSAFNGTFVGKGFNTIFRPDFTPTPLPIPVAPSDNILELNLTTETLTFSKPLGTVPNRGTSPQQDIFLNGVPYLQAINDVTTPGESTGIHVEPGLWMIVPSTSHPAEPQSVTRMASIPHGTTINAQGTFLTVQGGPQIDSVDITPFEIDHPGNKISFDSQIATNNNTPRIPQDLTPFIAAGTITPAILKNPNQVLSDAIVGQNITSTDVLIISTSPTTQTNPVTPLFGGGTDNIAFLLGDAATPPPNPNANAVQMTATFWIETVEETIVIPAHHNRHTPFHIKGAPRQNGDPTVVYEIHAPASSSPRNVTVSYRQIQYTQTVFLNFATLTWPHVSVATLVPSEPIHVHV